MDKFDDYKPESFALEIFKKRYALHDNESFEEACDRVATAIAFAEKGNDISLYKDKFSKLLKKNLFMPGGRILYGSGRPKGQLLNCFVVDTTDSREGWGQTVNDMIVICGTGGGLGLNFSSIRPRGSKISGHSGAATGAVSLMEIIDSAGSVIKAGGGRRTALMFCLGLNHGDILEFLDKKLDHSELNNANVSVMFDDDPEIFFDNVRKNADFKLRFGSKIIGKTSAKAIWDKIIANALKNGEPGLLNGYLANKMNNVWYYTKLPSTNPCAEIWLAPNDACCLGAVVLPRFIKKNGQLDFESLSDAVKLSHRFLDNVLTVNNYPLQKIKEMCQNIRRVGLGIMGLHDTLLMMGLSYSSPEGLEMVDKIMRTVKDSAYENSIELAKEKGSFPALDVDKFLKGGFAKTLKPSIRENIKKYGIRNCASLTIAPTGTTSLICDVTSGIEPMFAAAHIRKYRDGDELKKETVVHPLFKKFVKEGKSVDHFESSHDLSLRSHFEMQATCQKHIDNAVSKTINVPHGTPVDEFSDLYMEYFPVLKGVTVYPEGSREDQPLTPLDFKQALKYASSDNVEATAIDSCKDGMCEI